MFEMWMIIKEIVLVVGLTIMSIEDIRRREIRRIWLIGLGMVGIVIAIVAGDIDGAQYLFRLVPGIVCFLVAWVTGEQIGFGDAFLIFIMGLYCNVTELINVCMFALILVGIVSLFLMTVAKKSKKYELPFIPFVFLGRMVWLFCV